MGCKQSKTRVYVAGSPELPQTPQTPGVARSIIDEVNSPSSIGAVASSPKTGSLEAHASDSETPLRGFSDSAIRRPSGDSPHAVPSTLVTRSTSTSTRKLALDQKSRSTQTLMEARLAQTLPSARVIMHVAPRVRRFSIAAESIQQPVSNSAGAGASIHTGGGSPAHASGEPTSESAALLPPPEFPKSDAEKTFLLESLSKSFLFSSLQADELAITVDAMFEETVPSGHAVITQGDAGDKFYVIGSGRMGVTVDGAPVATLKPQDSFGELALMYDCPRNASVIAESDCIIWALDRYTFKRTVVQAAQASVQERVDFLRRVEILSTLSRREVFRLAEVLTPVSFEKGDTVVSQGDEGNVFYFIRAGQVSVFKKDEVTDSEGNKHTDEVEIIRLGIGSFFGEQALIHRQARSASVRAVDHLELLALHAEFFTPLLSPVLSGMRAVHSRRELAEQRVRSSRKLMRTLDSMDGPESRSLSPSSAPPPPDKEIVDIELSDLSNVAVLGEGAFGVVRLVKHKVSSKVYALKVMQKQRIVAMSQQRNILMEKNVMMRAQHPYILKLYKTYQDRDCLYMLLEFCQGGDMFTLLGRQGGRLESSAARHYAAVVTSVLEYLHARHVVYRDLKPENLVFDSEGHLKVCDFGFSKIVRNSRTYTLCGTPEYLAPELVTGNGHHHGVDYWALGILIYEMLCGYSPFADHAANSQIVIYRQIVAGKYHFPSALTDSRAKDLIRKLLHPKSSKRLGCLVGGTEDVKRHEWFTAAEFNWAALMAKRIAPPIVPKLTSGPCDLTFFDEIEDPGMGRIEPYRGDATNWDADF